jgi:hypothetical protein
VDQGLLCRIERGQEASLHFARTETKRRKKYIDVDALQIFGVTTADRKFNL